MTRLLIEGWRGVNHSFAMVNQCQILALHGLPGVQLQHRDLPLAMAHWNASTHNPGFAPADWQRIADLPAPDGWPVDCVYRICSPFRDEPAAAEAPRLISFMVTEMGLSHKSFCPGTERSEVFTRDDNLIVTPTQWSRERLLEWGYAPDKVKVLSHGVNSTTFCPPSAAQRQHSRQQLGYADDQYIFLNLGAAFWNKGMDVLLLAYARLRQKHPHVRLILKDQRNVYGVGIEQTIAELCRDHPALFGQDTLASISTITANLNQAQLCSLYALSDCYVSTYRAEGFNLPVLEAMACGTPVVVTQGGATDDFCGPELALFVASQAGSRNTNDSREAARYREPDPEATVATMERMLLGQGIARDAAFEQARQQLCANMAWSKVAQQLLALTTGARTAAAQAS